jgi:Xaa-Pro aminopeptidase
MNGKSVFGERIRKVAKEAGRAGLDGVIIVPGPNLAYVTGVHSLLLERPFLLLVPEVGEPSLVAPVLEAGPYKRCGVRLRVREWTDSQGAAGAIEAAIEDVGLEGTWGVEGRAPFLFLHRLQKQASVKLEDAEPILQGLREIKDDAEIRLMKRSARILSNAYEEIPSLVRQGMTENELAKKISDVIFAKGATRIEDMLVQSGERAADPHSLPTKRKIGRGEGIIVDISSVYEGYYADITRTFCIGDSEELESVYANVLEAQKSAIAVAGEGVEVGAVDRAARSVLKRAGLGGYFTHRTGHGLGLEVHEAPYVVEGGRERLRRGMFFTVEPGAYLPGRLGVRIEDDLMIEGKRAAEITRPPKDYGWWR